MRTSAILSGLILQNSVRRANNSDLDDLVSKADRSESSAPRVPNHLLVVIVLLVGHCLLPTEQLQEADRSSGPTLEGQSSNFTAYVADQKPSRAVTKSSTSGRRPSRPPGRKWTGEEFYSAPGGGDAPRAGREMLAAHFSDFDDFAALNLSSFYSLPSSAASSRRKFERKRSNGTNFYTAAVSSNNHRATSASRLALAAGGGDQCALALATGGCISFNMVEWAARLARRALRFEQPEDLNSLEPDEPTINAVGELNELTTRLLAARFGLTAGQVAFELDQIDVSRTSLWRSCPRIYRQPLARPCRADFSPSGSGPLQQVTGRYRTLTGACNNPLAPQLGSALMPFVRLLPPDYADGVGLPRGLLQGHLPPARLVSLELHPDLKSASSDLSVLFAMWGQLINHDLAMASGARGKPFSYPIRVAIGVSSGCRGRNGSLKIKISVGDTSTTATCPTDRTLQSLLRLAAALRPFFLPLSRHRPRRPVLLDGKPGRGQPPWPQSEPQSARLLPHPNWAL